MDWPSVITAGPGTAIGGAITWFVSRWYYRRASNELSAEADQIRQLTILMLRGMEAANWVEFNHDEQGKPVGIVFKASGGGTLGLSGELTTRLIHDSDED